MSISWEFWRHPKEFGHLTGLLPLFFPPTLSSFLPYFLAGVFFPSISHFTFLYYSLFPLLFSSFSYLLLSSTPSFSSSQLHPPGFSFVPHSQASILEWTIWPLFCPCTPLCQHSKGHMCNICPKDTSVSWLQVSALLQCGAGGYRILHWLLVEARQRWFSPGG